MTKILNPRFSFLAGAEKNVTSQFGEDGLIAALFQKIGMLNRWCFEVGACDGVLYSNTKVLRDAGWSAVLIEANEAHRPALDVFASDRVKIIIDKIGPLSLDGILDGCDAPDDLDLGVLDIDGQEYWCWHGMQHFTPRVMLVEYSPYEYTKPDFLVPLGGEGQSGINPILELGSVKGYVPALATFCNVLFVRKDCVP